MRTRFLAGSVASLALVALLLVLTPAGAQQDAPRWDCCYHVFSVASNLAWAGTLAMASIPRQRLEPADETILTFMENAARHAETACSVCSKFNNLWNGWAGLPSAVREQARVLRSQPDSRGRTSVAGALRSMINWSEPLRAIRAENVPGAAATCEQMYYQIAWHLAWMQGSLQIVQEARGSGNQANASLFSEEAWAHLQLLLPVLHSYRGRLDGAPIPTVAIETAVMPIRDARRPEVHIAAVRTAWENTQRVLIDNCSLTTRGVIDVGSQAGWCVIRQEIYPSARPGRCFEFRVVAAGRDGTALAVINNARNLRGTPPRCFITNYGNRQGWQVEPSAFGGPFLDKRAADEARAFLSRYGTDPYGCFGQPTPPPPLPAPVPAIPPESFPTNQPTPPVPGQPPTPPQPNRQSTPTTNSVSVSGGFEPEFVQAEVKHASAYRARVTYDGPALTLRLPSTDAGSPAAISPHAVQVTWNYSRPDGTSDLKIMTMTLDDGRVVNGTLAQGRCGNIIIRNNGVTWQGGVLKPYTMPDQRLADQRWSAGYDREKGFWRVTVSVPNVPPWALR
jgi:hypothetical protein